MLFGPESMLCMLCMLLVCMLCMLCMLLVCMLCMLFGPESMLCMLLVCMLCMLFSKPMRRQPLSHYFTIPQKRTRFEQNPLRGTTGLLRKAPQKPPPGLTARLSSSPTHRPAHIGGKPHDGNGPHRQGQPSTQRFRMTIPPGRISNHGRTSNTTTLAATRDRQHSPTRPTGPTEQS